MTQDLMEKLQSIDPAVLTQVVRQDQRSPAFEIGEWLVRRLSDKGVMNPERLGPCAPGFEATPRKRG